MRGVLSHQVCRRSKEASVRGTPQRHHRSILAIFGTGLATALDWSEGAVMILRPRRAWTLVVDGVRGLSSNVSFGKAKDLCVDQLSWIDAATFA